jgi:molecular chaperone GrpE
MSPSGETEQGPLPEDPERESAGETAPGAEDAAPQESAAGASDLEAEVASLKDRLLRAMAEAENTRRRAEREKADAQKFGISRFARDILSVADNLSRALEALPDEARGDAPESIQNLITGIEMTARELEQVLGTHGVTPVSPSGERFDPNFHQAMAEVPTADHPAGTVVDVYQVGYRIDDRLLRPAMVTVAKAPPAPAPDPGPDETPEPGSGVDTTV